MAALICISDLSKTYESGFEALKNVSLEIADGEIIALLGPNGAGKTTLISIICGLVNATGGTVHVAGHDHREGFRQVRSMVGLVPQEIATDVFTTVWDAVRFSRALFGRPPDPEHLESVLRDLALWDRKDSPIVTLSGGMKRRVMIAKALSHEPRILFLDEPTAGVDVELRKDMWALVRRLHRDGVTIILTTHYIEEAEAIAERVAVINHGEIIVVDNKVELMRKLGRKRLILELHRPIETVPQALERFGLEIGPGANELVYTYDTQAERTGITRLLSALSDAGIRFRDLRTVQSSLEDIFVTLVRDT